MIVDYVGWTFFVSRIAIIVGAVATLVITIKLLNRNGAEKRFHRIMYDAMGDLRDSIKDSAVANANTVIALNSIVKQQEQCHERCEAMLDSLREVIHQRGTHVEN